MAPLRYAGKIDHNQPEIVEALRDAGVTVLSLAPMGKGCADLLVWVGGKNHPNRSFLLLLEVKDGAKPPSERRLTPDQVKFHAIWPVTVVTSPAEALRACGLG